MVDQDLQSVPNLSETSDKVSELLDEVEVVNSNPEPVEESVFEELGLTPLEILKYIIIFVVLIGVFIYGSVKVFNILFPSESSGSASVVKVIQPVSNEGEQDVDIKESIDTSSSTTIDTSNNNNLKIFSKSLPLVFEIHESNNVASNLAKYVRSYQRMKNIYNINIASFLDASSDRETAYFQYVNEFETALIDLKLSVNSLTKEIEYFTEAVNKAVLELDSSEQIFFNNVQNLNDSKIDTSLNVFQNLSTKKNNLTSELKAREAIFARISQNINALNSKLEAVKLNKEPLLSGLQVIDVQGVDLNLITR
ncbi:MAG: hypothetical protein ACON4M_07690 [Crocinitomicaceae bacterium]